MALILDRVPVNIGIGVVNDQPASDVQAQFTRVDADGGARRFGGLQRCDQTVVVPQLWFAKIDGPAGLGRRASAVWNDAVERCCLFSQPNRKFDIRHTIADSKI